MACREPVKVLYVLGVYRSGTTVLGNLVGQLDGFASVGELWALWRELADPASRCGCGRPLPDCPVWAQVLERAYGAGAAPAVAAAMWQWHAAAMSHRHGWRNTRLLRADPARTDGSPLARYGAGLTDLYQAIRAVTGARVVVDSSKETGDAALLRRLPGVDPYVVHIVRDPRGTAYSSLRDRAGTGELGRGHPRRSAYIAGSWLLNNLAAAAVRRAYGPQRSMPLRYEDFVGDPAGTLGEVARLVGEHVDVAERAAAVSVLRPTHTVAGNTNRFRTGRVAFTPDLAWRRHLPVLDRRVVSALTAPLLAHHGYPLRGGRHQGQLPAGSRHMTTATGRGPGR